LTALLLLGLLAHAQDNESGLLQMDSSAEIIPANSRSTKTSFRNLKTDQCLIPDIDYASDEIIAIIDQGKTKFSNEAAITSSNGDEGSIKANFAEKLIEDVNVNSQPMFINAKAELLKNLGQASSQNSSVCGKVIVSFKLNRSVTLEQAQQRLEAYAKQGGKNIKTSIAGFYGINPEGQGFPDPEGYGFPTLARRSRDLLSSEVFSKNVQGSYGRVAVLDTAYLNNGIPLDDFRHKQSNLPGHGIHIINIINSSQIRTMPLKTCEANGICSEFSSIVQLCQASNMKLPIINMSYGSFFKSALLETRSPAFLEKRNADANERGKESCVRKNEYFNKAIYPANFSKPTVVASVGAVDNQKSYADYATMQRLDLTANGYYMYGQNPYRNGSQSTPGTNGTSYAAARVSAVAAKLANSNITASRLLEQLKNYATQMYIPYP
jgi:hypothetical protein